MRQRYNLERSMPVVLEVTFDELRLIENLARAVVEQEDMPDGVWKGELRDLLESVQGAIKEVASDAAQHFAGVPSYD
jgi:hypothetical protein